MNQLRYLTMIGAGLGVADQLAALFPDPKPPRELTDADRIALLAAQAKRDRRAAKHKPLTLDTDADHAQHPAAHR